MTPQARTRPASAAPATIADYTRLPIRSMEADFFGETRTVYFIPLSAKSGIEYIGLPEMIHAERVAWIMIRCVCDAEGRRILGEYSPNELLDTLGMPTVRTVADRILSVSGFSPVRKVDTAADDSGADTTDDEVNDTQTNENPTQLPEGDATSQSA